FPSLAMSKPMKTRRGKIVSPHSKVKPEKLTTLDLLRLVVDTTVKALFDGSYTKYAKKLKLKHVAKKKFSINVQLSSVLVNGMNLDQLSLLRRTVLFVTS
ncbi:MAG: hypothetical protein FWE43_05030, partial [Streptococcaceae bacterium]|nr:hypothetical protein [Streptococcaceae bacterium]